MNSLHSNFEDHYGIFSEKTDYARLLSLKFSPFDEKNSDSSDLYLEREIQSSGKHISDNEEKSEIMARGRKQKQAACLRISKIEKVLATRSDLTKAERRALQSRKNTANFRERRKKALELKHFLNIEI